VTFTVAKHKQSAKHFTRIYFVVNNWLPAKNGPRQYQIRISDSRIYCSRSRWIWQPVLFFLHQEHWLLIFEIRLSPLTSDYGDEPCPKSLLPIANKPLLDYALVWLEQSGVKGTLQHPLHYFTPLNHSSRCPSHLPC
jgi:hypothetical protein